MSASLMRQRGSTSFVSYRGNASGAEVAATFIGTLPGPVKGMSACNRAFVDHFARHGRIRILDINHWWPGTDKPYRVRRLFAHLLATAYMVFCRRFPDEALYLPVNGNAGMLMSILEAAVARLRGFRIFLHHHGYSYLSHRSRIAAVFFRVASSAVHIVHCQKMETDLRRHYRSIREVVFAYPSIVKLPVAPDLIQSDSPSEPFRMGLLSNLTMSKGVSRAVETLEELLRNGRHVTLTFAGPLADSEAGQCIDHAIEQFPGRVFYLGALYGEQKEEFFRSLNVFVFPTLYRHESWGIVLNEALASGVPSITFRRSCIPVVIDDTCGLLIEETESFSRAAAAFIADLIDHPRQYQLLRRGAITKAQTLDREEQQLTDSLAQLVMGGPVTPRDELHHSTPF